MAVDLAALERTARTHLDSAVYDYFAGGAEDELTVADNVAAWQRIRLRPRVLRDVSAVSVATTVLGTEVAMPVLLAPTGYQRLAHDDGERATARAAAAAGTVMTVSTFSTVSLEDVAEAAPGGHRWFQLYVLRDRAFSADLVRRAEAAGYGAVVLTVDLPVLGTRHRDEVDELRLPPGMEMANLTRRPELVAFEDDEIDPSVTFADIGWLREITSLPVVVKGVLRGDDAAAAVDAGATAVIVSNHGGRQLDTTVATADALVELVAAVDGRAEVYVDGGVRTGTSVVKALALGARAVLIGRPFLWGLVTAGEEGVRSVLASFQEETARAFALCGVRAPDEVGFDLLA